MTTSPFAMLTMSCRTYIATEVTDMIPIMAKLKITVRKVLKALEWCFFAFCFLFLSSLIPAKGFCFFLFSPIRAVASFRFECTKYM